MAVAKMLKPGKDVAVEIFIFNTLPVKSLDTPSFLYFHDNLLCKFSVKVS